MEAAGERPAVLAAPARFVRGRADPRASAQPRRALGRESAAASPPVVRLVARGAPLPLAKAFSGALLARVSRLLGPCVCSLIFLFMLMVCDFDGLCVTCHDKDAIVVR